MKNFFTLFLIFSATHSVQAQYFNNSNNELCLELYRQYDEIGQYRVYMIIDELDEKDQKILSQWDTLDGKTKTTVTQRWTAEGKRIETDRAPFVTKAPVFPKTLKKPDLQPVPKPKNSPDPWGGVGRTGTVVGCYLLKQGMANKNTVLETVKTLKKNTTIVNRVSPETEEQREFVLDWI